MTVPKLCIGVGKVASTREERQAVDAVLDSCPVVEMTPSVSRRAGQLLGERLAAADMDDGPSIGKGDAVIAATALERNESVLTGDSHFAMIPGITVETYR